MEAKVYPVLDPTGTFQIYPITVPEAINMGTDNESLRVVLGKKAPLDSPAFTGTPTSTTPSSTDSSTNIATTAFVKNQIADITFTLTAANWVGTNAPFTYTATVTGITESMKGSVGVSDTATDAQYQAALNAQIRKYAQAADSLSFKAYGDKPTVDIPCVVRIVR